MGVGEAYVDGDWSSPELRGVMRLAVRHLTRLEESHRLLSLASRVLDRICRKLQLGPEDHVIEIGTGWGGLAVHAARHYGCRVTTTTISREQHDYAAERFARDGLAPGRIQLLFEDYRNLRGRFDKLVSIEMFEAVGYRYYDQFFGVCDRLLTPHGAMLLQTITLLDQHFRQLALIGVAAQLVEGFHLGPQAHRLVLSLRQDPAAEKPGDPYGVIHRQAGLGIGRLGLTRP